MKKTINLIIIFVLGLFFITGCSNKSALEAIDFVDLIEQNDYVTTNVKGEFSDYPQITNAFIAQNKDMTYQLEYYEFDNIDNCKTFYDGNVKIFKQQEKIKSKKSLDTNKYQKYMQTSETTYSIISRIDNTVVYANVKKEYKDEVNKIILTIGY